MLPRSQLRSADSSPVPSNPDSLANSPVTPFLFERDLGGSGGTGTSTTTAASRSFRLPDSDVAGSTVVQAAAAVRSPPRPDFVPKLALGQPEAERGTEAAADNQRQPLVNELSLEQVPDHRTRTYRTPHTHLASDPVLGITIDRSQILEEQTELPLAKPGGPRLASVMFRKRCEDQHHPPCSRLVHSSHMCYRSINATGASRRRRWARQRSRHGSSRGAHTSAKLTANPINRRTLPGVRSRAPGRALLRRAAAAKRRRSLVRC